MKINEAISLVFGSAAVYLLILGCWSLGHGPHESVLWVGLWHPAILGFVVAVDGCIIASEVKPPELTGPDRKVLKARDQAIEEAKVARAELEALKLAITDKELRS